MKNKYRNSNFHIFISDIEESDAYELIRHNAKYYVGEIDFKSKNSKEIYELVLEANKREPSRLISALSIKTYRHLRELLYKNTGYEYSFEDLCGEDCLLLMNIGVLSMDRQEISDDYYQIISQIISQGSEEIKNQIITNSIIKGVVDIYGYMTFSEFLSLMRRRYHNGIHWYKKDIIKVIKESVLISSTTIFNNEEIYRYELESKEDRDYLIKFRDSFKGIWYKSYSVNEAVDYCGTFDLYGKENFLNIAKENTLLIENKSLAFPLYYSSHNPRYFDHKREIRAIENSIPKWLLKGWTIKAFPYKGFVNHLYKDPLDDN